MTHDNLNDDASGNDQGVVISLGCGDNGCEFHRPKVGTNGGCRCLKDIRPTSLRLEVTRKLRLLKNRLHTAKEMQDAYLEGFDDGESHGNIDWKYQPMTNAFGVSDARKKIMGCPNEHIQLVADQYRNAKIKDKNDHVLSMAEVGIETSI